MQAVKRQPQDCRTSVLCTTRVAVPVFAAFFSLGFYAPCSFAVAGTTAWAQSVRAHLGLQTAQAVSDTASASSNGAPDPTDMRPTIAGAPAHEVTGWARSVETHLADRAHHVAEVGREAIAWSESGMASWYGGRRAGHLTSSGAVFNPMQLTCAHPTLPLGTRLLVTSQTTGRSVVVTVNDRGPFGGRIVDLSREAAERIGMLGSGTANVTLEKASPEVVEVADAEAGDTSAQAIAASDDGVATPHARHRTHHSRR